MNLEHFSNISLELALNSRVSTGGWKGEEKAGNLSSKPLTRDQIEFVFWCLSHTPSISEEAVVIECDGKKFDKKTLTLDGEEIALKSVVRPRFHDMDVLSPTIRLHWTKKGPVQFSTDIENAYWVERGMAQEMVHIAGSIGQMGVCIIGGVYVDLVPMIPYLSSKPPQNFRKGNLPTPLRDGGDSAVECFKKWKPSEAFDLEKITKFQLGQLLWAGFGCTPHNTYSYNWYGTLNFWGQGKTIPSASAIPTTSLYVIEDDGIFKYVNWNEEESVATHSLGLIRKGDPLKVGEYRNGTLTYVRKGDLLQEVNNLLPKLPEASTYILITTNGRHPPYFSLMEAGYSALNVVLQAQALNMKSNIVVISKDQMGKIQQTIGVFDVPIAFVPIG